MELNQLRTGMMAFMVGILLVFLTLSGGRALLVYPDDGSGSEFDSVSGNATFEWNARTYYNDYPYMIDGHGELQSGSGLGYYGTDVSWETATNEVDGGTTAHFNYELDYDEDGDATGLANAYYYYTFRVYEWTGTTWNLVGQDTNCKYNDFWDDTFYLDVDYDFGSSRYKFRHIQKVYWGYAQITDANLVAEITDEGHETCPALYIED